MKHTLDKLNKSESIRFISSGKNTPVALTAPTPNTKLEVGLAKAVRLELQLENDTFGDSTRVSVCGVAPKVEAQGFVAATPAITTAVESMAPLIAPRRRLF